MAANALPAANFWAQFHRLQVAGTPFCCVTLVDEIGSVPAVRGAKMLVTRAGLAIGTVGGGKIEARALTLAREMLNATDGSRFEEWNLNRDLGMTCGGVARLYFEVFNVARWPIVIFGAGHVAQALVRVLLPLDCGLTCYDSRPEWLNQLPEGPGLQRVLCEDLAGAVPDLPARAFVVLMTMGHATDLPILRELLRRGFPYIGVIGSKGKAAALRRALSQDGLGPEDCARFFCPMGLPLGNNHPHEIAISIAAQLLQQRDASM